MGLSTTGCFLRHRKFILHSKSVGCRVVLGKVAKPQALECLRRQIGLQQECERGGQLGSLRTSPVLLGRRAGKAVGVDSGGSTERGEKQGFKRWAEV